jgi:predicted metal-dependent peptidase
MVAVALQDPVVNSAEVERKVAKAKSLLILDHPFFGTAVTKRPIKYTDAVPTAAMSATGQIYINPEFAEPLTVRQLMFLLAHEAMHYMLGHSLRRKHRDPMAWNIAADKVINDTLIDAKVGDFIDGGVTLDGARNNAAEELYDENENGEGQGAGGIGNDIGDPVDDGGQQLDDSQIHQLEAEAKIEAIQSAKAAKAVGKLPGSIERLIDDMVNVTTPWHEILERFMQAKVKDGYSWQRPNRRFVGRGLYLPGVDYTPRMGEIIIAIDTSGSLMQDDLNMFNGHINRILHTCLPEKVHVIYCDYSINGTDEYTPDDLPITAKLVGGGGTSFKPVFEWADNYDGDIECIVYLTDGYGDQNEITTNHETVWLTTGSENFQFGTVIKFEE